MDKQIFSTGSALLEDNPSVRKYLFFYMHQKNCMVLSACYDILIIVPQKLNKNFTIS